MNDEATHMDAVIPEAPAALKPSPWLIGGSRVTAGLSELIAPTTYVVAMNRNPGCANMLKE
ncbi:hypothetical protein JZ751_021081, partial [Albula glossodonta]